MALTAEQENQLEFLTAQNAIAAEQDAARRAADAVAFAANNEATIALEQKRHQNSLEIAQAQAATAAAQVEKQAKLEAVRLAKETLIENRRSAPVGERDVTAEEIAAFAATLVNYIKS